MGMQTYSVFISVLPFTAVGHPSSWFPICELSVSSSIKMGINKELDPEHLAQSRWAVSTLG